MPKTRILFLCTGNSCRSQMAEGWAKYLHGNRLAAFSAGVETHGLNPYAVRVMAEEGVDLSAHRSQLLAEFALEKLDYIITVCDHAHESCPLVPPTCRVIHQGFADPPRLAENMESEEEILDCYRRVRDEIKEYVMGLPENLKSWEKENE